MAQLSDLKLKYRLLIQGYPFRRIDWRPGTSLRKPLKDARIALITTAGVYLPSQKPFDQSYRHGDCSFRAIPWGTPVETLQIGQSSDAFDHSGIETDRNLALPLDRLRELVEAGVVGEAAPRQFSIMGSLIAPAGLISESGPELRRSPEVLHICSDRVATAGNGLWNNKSRRAAIITRSGERVCCRRDRGGMISSTPEA